MSDNWIVLIPKDPRYLPSEENIENAICFFKELAPDSDEFNSIKNEEVAFFDCGANFSSVSCPSCSQNLSEEAWQELMEEDFKNNGFILANYKLPCCGSSHNLNQLKYDWHQGFSKFALEAMNPNLGNISQETVAKFEKILGSNLNVIYQHI